MGDRRARWWVSLSEIGVACLDRSNEPKHFWSELQTSACELCKRLCTRLSQIAAMPRIGALAEFLGVLAAFHDGAGWTAVRGAARCDSACCQRIMEVVLCRQGSWCRRVCSGTRTCVQLTVGTPAPCKPSYTCSNAINAFYMHTLHTVRSATAVGCGARATHTYRYIWHGLPGSHPLR